MDANDPAENPDLRKVREACLALAEHFDSVMIFCSRHEGSDVGTITVNYGQGNWCARKGQVSDWLLKEQESTRINVRRDNEDEE